jgi:hypothetical protein
VREEAARGRWGWAQGCLGSVKGEIMKYALDVIGCPPATQDVRLNLRNRAWAIANVSYGPPNPNLPNVAYWQDRAREWGTTTAVAKTMRCGNCAAFNESDQIKSCIEMGIGDGFAEPFIAAGELGYCMAFKFKCAARRTCSAWVVGGPVRG